MGNIYVFSATKPTDIYTHNCSNQKQSGCYVDWNCYSYAFI